MSRSVGWWRGLRNRLLASPAFQRWSIRFPLTRAVGRRHANAIFALASGFIRYQILHACVRLGLLEALRDATLTVAEAAQRFELPEDSARRLLRGAADLELVERLKGTPEAYGLGLRGAALLGNPAACVMIEHNALLYRDLQDPLALLRDPSNTQLQAYWSYARSAASGALTDAETATYTALMAASNGLVADQVLDAWSAKGVGCLLDVGGGNGTFLSAVHGRWPDLSLMLFDLPAVVEGARSRFADAGLGAVALHGGDFSVDPLPRGADVVSFIRVLHDHDDPLVEHLLASAFAALPAGGTLLIGEPMSGTAHSEGIGDVYFSFYLLAMGSGRPRTVAEYDAMLRTAGFREVRAVPTALPVQCSLLVARKPSA